MSDDINPAEFGVPTSFREQTPVRIFRQADIDRAVVKAWRDAADKVDTGPTFPLLPSIISSLLREHADALEAHYAVRGES